MTVVKTRINKQSAIPLYHQLARVIEQTILDGDLKPADRLESETEMMRRYKLSRATVRKAIDLVEQRGLVIRKQGIGTTVASSEIIRPLELRSLFDDLVEAKQEPTTRVLTFETVQCPAEVVALCPELDEGEEVVHIRRLRSAAKQPVAILETWMRPARVSFGPSELARDGLYRLIQESGHVIHSALQQIGARLCDAVEAELLDEKPGQPLLTMTRATFDEEGELVEFGIHAYSAGRHRFELRLLNR